MKRILSLLIAMIMALGCVSLPAMAEGGNVAKVGNTEYATIDEAIAAWTNGTTLTLLADVTLPDVIKLSSTEYHILDLGTYTMTAASKKDAIQIENNGRTSASYALDIKADVSTPGGIIATGKAVVLTTGKSGVKDRPIIRFYGGVFNATNIVYHSGSNGTNCPQFQFHDGEFNGTIYTNRALNQFYGGTFNGSLLMSVDSSAYTLVAGGTFKQLSNLYMSALNSEKFTIGSAKGVYDKEVYIDDKGNYVIAAAEPAQGFEASVAKNPGTNDYLAYSQVATEGKLNYTNATLALKNNNNTSATVTVYTDTLDMTGINYKGTIVVPEGEEITIIVKEGMTPAWTVPEGSNVTYTDADGNVLKEDENGSFVKPAPTYVAKIGDKYYTSFESAVADIKQDGSDTTIEILTDIETSESIEFKYATGGVIFTADHPVTVKQTSLATDWAMVDAKDTKFVIDENVTFEIYDNASGMYLYYGPSIEIKGSVIGGQNWGTLYLFNGDHKVTETGKIGVGRIQTACNTLEVKGEIDTNYLLVENATFVSDGAKIDAGVIYDNNNGGQRWGASEFVIKNSSEVTTNKLTLSYADSELAIDASSSLAATEIVGAGKIIIDATGMTAGDVSTISGNASGFTGTIEVINNDYLEANIDENGNIVLTAVAKTYVAQINDEKYETLQAAAKAAKAGDTITMLADSTVTEDITLPAGITFNGNGFTVSGGIIADGNITFAGITKAKDFDVNYTGTTITIGEGACLELTGTDRMVIGHNCTFNITGTITDAKTANVADLAPSLIVAAGASFTGTNLTFNVTNAYIKFNSNSTSKNKNANGTFNFNITNSIWEQTGVLGFYVPTEGMDPTFNLALKDSVLTSTSHLVFSVSKGEIVIDNSNVNVGTSKQIENRSKMTIKNGSVVNGAVATSSNAINPGTLIVENATYAVSGQFSGAGVGTGTLIIKKGAKVSVGSIVDKANIVIDATGMAAGETIDFTANLSKFTGTVEVINNDALEAKIEDGKIVLVTKPVAYIGDKTYATLEEALKALANGDTLTLLTDVTIDYAWDERNTGARIKVPATIDGNGKTITFACDVADGNNYHSAFRVEADGMVEFKNLTIDMSSATNSKDTNRIRAISAKGDLTVNNCTFIGNTSLTNTRAIIFGEGSAHNPDTEITIKGSTFTNWKKGVTDNENGKDMGTVTITGNKFTDAGVALSASGEVTFAGNTVTGGYVSINSYSKSANLVVTAIENTLTANVDEKNVNYIDVASKNVTAQDEFYIPAKGTNSPAFTKEVDGYVRVWGEGGGNAKESFVLKLYSEDTLMATTELNNIGGIINGNVNVTWNFFYPESNDEYWTTTWEKGHPNALDKPTKVELYIDGTLVSTTAAQMNGPDNLNPVIWEDLGGVKFIPTGLSGEGTEENPYKIGTSEELFLFASKVNDGTYTGVYAELTADIDLEQEEWTSIGTSANPFTGTFDGKDFTISNVWSYERGLFGFTSYGNYVDGPKEGRATIKNLTINGVEVYNQTTSAVGGVVGQAGQNTEISGVTVTGYVQVWGYGYVGGIVGQGYVHIDDCHVIGVNDEAGDISEINAAYWAVAGIVGHAGSEGGASITNCSVENIKIYSSIYGAGSIAGVGTSGKIENVSAKDVIVEAQSSPDANGYLVGCNYDKITGNSTATNVTLIVNDVEHPSTDMVAKVGNIAYVSLESAIKAAAPSGTVEILRDVTVDEWVMFSQTKTIAGDSIITLGMNGLTINGNNRTITVKAVESATNGGYLFDNAENIIINDLTVSLPDGSAGLVGGSGGTLTNVTIKGGDYSLTVSKTKNLTLKNCTFEKESGTAIYTPGEGDASLDTPYTSTLTIDGCEFKIDTGDGGYAVILRGENDVFKNNVTNNRVNVLGENVTLTGNTFNARLKFYPSNPTVENNQILGSVAYDDATETIDLSQNYWGENMTEEDILAKAGEKATVSSYYAEINEDGTLDGFVTIAPRVATVNGVEYSTLQAALDAAAAGSGNVTVEILDDIDLSNVDWKSVTVSAPGYPVVTVNGNGKTITGLNDMLFAGTWAGGSGLIINDLTIADSTIVNDENDAESNVGVGAFIGFPQASATITLNNCHLVNSTVKGGHWTGGLIGYAAGYAGNDGPVFMNLTIKNCSVKGSNITGKGSVGGVIGHGSGNGWTNVVVENTTVSGNTITSTGSSTNKAGAVMGTIGAAGQPTTANGETKTGGASVSATVSDNTVTSNGATITTIYGRQGTSTGLLIITGGTYDNNPIEENVGYAQPMEGFKIVENENGTYGLAAKVELFEFYGTNLTLGNIISINFYVDKANLEGEDYYAIVTHYAENGTIEEKIPYSNWFDDERGNYKYVSYSKLAAKQMSDDIKVVIYDGNGTQVSEEKVDGIRTYSLRMIGKDTTREETKIALVDMLNYGAAAQTEFKYKVNDLANSGAETYQELYASKDVSENVVDIRKSDENYYGSALTLESNIIYTGFFNNIEEGMSADVKYKDHYGNEVSYRIEYSDFKPNGSTHEIIVDTLVISDANQLITITVYDEEGNVHSLLEDSINSYLARMMGRKPIYEMIAKFTASAYNTMH